VPGRVALVVDDNEQNLELASFLLEEAGFEVLKAADAEQARAALRRRRPDVLLLDMNLAGADGLELVREIREDRRLAGVPVVALTAHAMRGDRERFLRGGCDDYIAKPIEVRRFVPQVEEALARGRRPSEREAER